MDKFNFLSRSKAIHTYRKMEHQSHVLKAKLRPRFDKVKDLTNKILLPYKEKNGANLLHQSPVQYASPSRQYLSYSTPSQRRRETVSAPCRPCAMIMAHLYLSAYPKAAADIPKEVTHILSMGTIQAPRGLPQSPIKAERTYLHLPIHNVNSIESYLEDIVIFIQEALENNGTVFVYCEKGQNRSAAAIIAYLVVHLGINSFEAFKLVKLLKNDIRPQPALLREIDEYFGRGEQLQEYIDNEPVRNCNRFDCQKRRVEMTGGKKLEDYTDKELIEPCQDWSADRACSQWLAHLHGWSQDEEAVWRQKAGWDLIYNEEDEEDNMEI